MSFIGCFIDYENDTIQYTEHIYPELNYVKYDLNFKIAEIIKNIYNKYIPDILLFIYDPFVISENSEQFYNLNNNNTYKLIFKRKGNVIDIYSDELKKGYIFNDNIRIHLYKFYIMKCNQINEHKYQYQLQNNNDLLDVVFCNPENIYTLYNNNISIESQFLSKKSSTFNNDINSKNDINENDINENDYILDDILDDIDNDSDISEIVTIKIDEKSPKNKHKHTDMNLVISELKDKLRNMKLNNI